MNQILCFGDSNTYGLIPGTQERFERGIRWTSLIEKDLYRKGYRVVEEGLCGRTSVFDDKYREGRNGSKLLPVLLETHSPIDIVVLMLGTNDCKYEYETTPQKIGDGIETLIDQIQTYDPNISILLISPIALGDKVWEEGYDTEFNEQSVKVSKELPKVYERIARRRGIDFLAASGYAKPSVIDREHLDVDGHRRLATAISDKLEKIISDKVESIEFCYKIAN